MPCCGASKRSSTTEPGGPSLTGTGIIQLQALEGCTDPECVGSYTGPERHRVAYLVGRGTKYERLFRDDQSKQAMAWRSQLGDGRQQRLRNDRILMAELPVRAAEELLAS